ncbi:MAG: YfhO family protein, partial [Clostridia bacterium]|nr:YfhO family protein [Clostridia bacterium]
MKRLENKWLLACLAFLVPAALLLVIFALCGVTPFGGRSLAAQDANIQYIEFFNYYRNLFHGEDTLAYSFTNFLGGSGVALFAYYLASPFNLLILLVPAAQNHALFSLLALLKLSLCGFTMALFLRERFPKLTPLFTLLLSVSFALMQYNIAQTMNIIWLDGVYLLPLILLGVYRLVRTGKSFLFFFATGAAILFNWYAGWFDCIAAILFFFWELGDVPEGTLDTKQKWGRFGTALLHGVAAVCLSAVLFLPSVYTLLGGKGRTDIKMSFGFSGNPLTSLAGFSLGTESFDGGMAVFCGSLVTLALLLYFSSRQFALKEKIRSGVLLFVFVLLAYWEPLAFIANGFRNITSYWYRYGYIVIAYLLFLAARYYSGVETETPARLYKAAVAAAGILFLVEFVSDYGTLSYIFGTSAFLLFFAWALTKLLPMEQGEDPVFAKDTAKRVLSVALTCAVCLELLISGTLIYRSTGFAKVGRYQDYHANRTEKVAAVKAADDSFYRIAQSDYRHKTDENLTAYFDDSYSYAYNGIAHYSSTYSNNQAELMCHLGYASDPTVPVTTTRMLAADSLLSVRYVLGEKDIPGLTKAEDLGEGICRNPYAIAPALVVDSGKAADYADFENDPFAYQNAL